MTVPLKETTIRDFGGGWDVSDSDKALGSRYQPISDNVVRATDGSFSVRPGTRLFADMKQGTETVVAADVCTVTTTAGSGYVLINKAAHGLADGNHINITAWSTTIGTVLTLATVGGVHGVHIVDANNFWIYVRIAGVTAGAAACTIGWTKDTHLLGGRGIFGRYFKNHIAVFSDTGEICIVDATGLATMIWNTAIAHVLPPPNEPWGPCDRISAEIVKGHLLAVNGSTNDQPLDIRLNGGTGLIECRYLVNLTSAVFTNIPRADFLIAADHYVLLISTGKIADSGPTKISISRADTYETFVGDAGTGDEIIIDVGMLTQSVETTILGANTIRDKVFIAFHDRSQLGVLGAHDAAGEHVPEFKDNVSQLGTYAHNAIISLGNDLLCPAMNGLNSLSISVQSGEYTPQTVSDLIDPVMLRHIARLSENDRRYRTFAVWDAQARQYMLFMPKYSALTYDLPDDPIVVSSTLQPNGLAYLLLPSHTFDAGDYVTIAGITGSPDGNILAASINGVRRIRAVLDDNVLVIEVPMYLDNLNYSFGGIAGTVTPVNDETPGYVYELNPRMKIRRWTRFRGLNFEWGAVSQLGSLFFGYNGRIYRMGNSTNKYSADGLGDYTRLTWANATAYVAGERILDATYREVFLVLESHTSPGAGTFKAARDANPDWYESFTGIPISWELETSWTDFKERMMNKQIEVVRFDTKGSSDFSFSVYTNSIRESLETFTLTPNRTTMFVGQDSHGFGAGNQPFGGGRNAREEWLHGMPVYGKMFRLRFASASILPLTISAATMYYRKMPGALT